LVRSEEDELSLLREAAAKVSARVRGAAEAEESVEDGREEEDLRLLRPPAMPPRKAGWAYGFLEEESVGDSERVSSMDLSLTFWEEIWERKGWGGREEAAGCGLKEEESL
jgi:hypothetical protein